MKNDILKARNSAIIEGISYRVVFKTKGSTYKIYMVDEKIKCIKNVKMKHIRIDGTNFLKDEFYYRASGAPSKGGRIKLVSQNDTYDMTIQVATGRVMLTKVTGKKGDVYE
ncbi:hypothetical protein [Dethiothermospora halolimnae]|uniref:hypothetical protein n=1 Tax=Dethiothermospora halolimnae TaxID=3114390 RepID=UPI003CCBFA40